VRFSVLKRKETGVGWRGDPNNVYTCKCKKKKKKKQAGSGGGGSPDSVYTCE
jgi:hypothetical protein